MVGDYDWLSRVRESTLRLRESESARQCEAEDRHHRSRLESLQSRVADWRLVSDESSAGRLEGKRNGLLEE